VGSGDADNVSGCSGRERSNASRAGPLFEGELGRAERVAGFFGRGQAGCSAKGGSVKKSARKVDLVGPEVVGVGDGIFGFDGFWTSLILGNGPAGLNALGRIFESSFTGSGD
jgi:hypothetical protein